MTEYSNENRGALFRNDRKERDTHPDYNGSINIDGVEYWLSAWIKEGRKGKFMSLSIKPKDDQPRRQEQSISQRAQAKVRQPEPAQSRHSYGGGDMDDQIPFAPEFR